MKILFQFDNLLNNEYLIRKFQVDPFNPSYLVLPYEVVQRENSIKNQYVQNENNTRKQYHIILTEILNEHNGKLWNYESERLLIKPFFPQERKKLQIKVHTDKKNELLQKVTEFMKESPYTTTSQPYQADPTFEKVYIVAQNEQVARDLFNHLKQEQFNGLVSSIFMENFDHLQEFQSLLQQKKMQRYLESRQLKQAQFQSEREQPKENFESKPEQGGYLGYKPRNQFQHKPYRNNKPYGQYQQRAFYVEKNNRHPEPGQPGYMLVRKDSASKTPKQTFKQPQTFTKDAKDFPPLDDKKQ